MSINKKKNNERGLSRDNLESSLISAKQVLASTTSMSTMRGQNVNNVNGHSLNEKDLAMYGMPIEEYRRQYKEEVETLWKEVERFRESCRAEIKRQEAIVKKYKQACERAMKSPKEQKCSEKQPDKTSESENKPTQKNNVSEKESHAPDAEEHPDFPNELKKLEENMVSLEKKQNLLDSEQELMEKEESLARRTNQLKEYEKNVEEAEVLLDKREALVKRRSTEIEFLNHDLLNLKQDLEKSVDNAENEVFDKPEEVDGGDQAVNTPQASSKARRNWQLARRHLFDKVTLLEATVQRYRTQVASSSATITANEMIIDRLQKENVELKEELTSREVRMSQLESRLTLTLQDKTRSEHKLELLLEELQNIDLTATSKMLQQSPEKQNNSKHSSSNNKSSVFSFLPLTQNSSSPSSNKGISRKRTKSLKLGTDKHGSAVARHHSVNGETSADDNARHMASNGAANSEKLDAHENGSKACVIM